MTGKFFFSKTKNIAGSRRIKKKIVAEKATLALLFCPAMLIASNVEMAKSR